MAAKASHDTFLCLMHSLRVCYEATLAKAGVTNDAKEKQRKKVLIKRTEKIEAAGREMKFIISGFQWLTQRTVKFIRWLRRFLWRTHPLDEIPRIQRKRY